MKADRERFITPEETSRLLAACPNVDWRTIVALCRFGGLRCPSEVLSLRWQDVDWDRERVRVHSPKTDHHPGKASREIPLFPELAAVLSDAFRRGPRGRGVCGCRQRLSPSGRHPERMAELQSENPVWPDRSPGWPGAVAASVPPNAGFPRDGACPSVPCSRGHKLVGKHAPDCAEALPDGDRHGLPAGGPRGRRRKPAHEGAKYGAADRPRR